MARREDRVAEALETTALGVVSAVGELAEIPSGSGGVGDQVLQLAGDIVLSHLQFLRQKQLEEVELPRADANFALKTLQVIQREKELMAWTGALSRVDPDELRAALAQIRDMKKAEKIISGGKLLSAVVEEVP